MNKTKLIASTAIAVGGVWVWLDYHNAVDSIMQRFPKLDLDYKTASKAYRTMILRGLQGKYNTEPDSSDETHDRIFMNIVREQAAQK